MKAPLTWVVAGALGGIVCGVVQACAVGDAVGSVTGALTIVVGRLATVGAALGLIAWFLDGLARRLVKNPRNARAVLLALLCGAVTVMIASGTHGHDGGAWGAFGFLAITGFASAAILAFLIKESLMKDDER